jgi:hypothetical protein
VVRFFRDSDDLVFDLDAFDGCLFESLLGSWPQTGMWRAPASGLNRLLQ